MIIPTVIDSDGRTDRAYDIYSRLLEDRIIYLGEDVSPHSANLIIAQLLFLESKDPNKDITLYINSPGGHVYDAFAIYDTIKFIKSDVSTVGIGMQASAAAFLLSSGAKGKRYILPNSTVMVHQPSSGTRGISGLHVCPRGLPQRQIGLVIQYMAENTGQKQAKLHDDMERDYWMSADEAVKYGIADKVITKR